MCSDNTSVSRHDPNSQVHISFKSYFPSNNILHKPTETWIRKLFRGHGRICDVSVLVYDLYDVSQHIHCCQHG